MKPSGQLEYAARMALEDAIGRFLLHIHNLSEKTQKNYRTSLELFGNSLPEGITIDLITPEHIDRFVSTYHEKHKASTTNTRLMAVKSLFSWLEERYRIPNITRTVKRLKELPRKQRVLKPEEYKLLCEKVNGYEIKVIKLLCHTGLRASELLSLRPENVDDRFITVLGKGRKIRRIPLNQTAKEILTDHNIFNLLKNTDQLNYLCKKAAKRAKIPKFSPHSCRHYFTTEIAKKGVPIVTISKLLGHSSITTTEKVYIHLSSDDLLGSTDVLD